MRIPSIRIGSPACVCGPNDAPSGRTSRARDTGVDLVAEGRGGDFCAIQLSTFAIVETVF